MKGVGAGRRWLVGAGLFIVVAGALALAPDLPAQPAQTGPASQHYQQALKLYQQGNYDGAAEALHKAVQIQPKFAEAHHLLGLVYFNGKKRPRAAVEEIQKALQVNPKLPKAHYDLAIVYQTQGKTAEAEQALQRAIQLDARDEDARLALARLYEHRAPAKAVQAYRDLLEVRPDHEEALYGLSYLLESQGDDRQATELLVRLLRVNSRHADAWYLMGRIAEKDNDLERTAEAYRQAIAAKPDMVDAHYNLAFIYRSQNKPLEAVRQFLEVIRLKPEYAEAHLNLGAAYTSLNKLDEAEHAYQQAIALKPHLAEAHYNLGVLYELHLKDTAKALASYHRYLDLGGKDERVERIVRQGAR